MFFIKQIWQISLFFCFYCWEGCTMDASLESCLGLLSIKRSGAASFCHPKTTKITSSTYRLCFGWMVTCAMRRKNGIFIKSMNFPTLLVCVSSATSETIVHFYFDEILVWDDFCEKLASFGFITLDKVVMLHFVLVIVSHLAFYQLCSRIQCSVGLYCSGSVLLRKYRSAGTKG